jgi:Zn-dependent metalloprotease
VTQCIIPPHMVESMKRRGSAEQREQAARLEAQAVAYRAEREAAAPPQAFLGARPATGQPTVTREVYDAGSSWDLPGRLVRSEGDPETQDESADAAYDGAGLTYDLFLQEYQRDSLDGRGMTLVSSVHVGQQLNNAFWDGSQMAYGDGDGELFLPFARSLSVVGHELTHGVVQFSGGLEYRDQSGALNESCADVFGSLVVQRHLGQSAAEADWLIGAEILGPAVTGEALRSMKAPGTAYDDDVLGVDPQPFHMDDYVITTADHGGVHINSGIPNHAFYLLAMLLGGNAWESAGAIWYDTLQAVRNPLVTFADWAAATVDQATTRFGTGSREALLTRRSWKLVGVDI